MKERLIGAAVLVALAVWLIPWVLDGPEPVAEDRSDVLELPAAEGAPTMRTQTIQLDERRDPPTPAAGRDEAPGTSSMPEASPETAEPEVSATDPAPAPAREERPPPKREAEAGDAEAGDWMIQLGSFGEEDNARRLADRVATFGFNARISTFMASGRPMYRVRVGPEPTRERALAVASSLSAHGFVTQVVPRD